MLHVNIIMVISRLLRAGIILVFYCSLSVVFAQQNSPVTTTSTYNQTINNYCVTCHNAALKTAGLNLANTDVNNVDRDGAIWEKVLRKLNARTMPPAGLPRPEEQTYDDLASYLESSLDRHAELDPQPGIPSLRRMNRTEYMNAIRELFSVEFGEDSLLPADDTLFGFDNIGSVLTLSPLLTEQYITAARKVRRQTIGDPEMRPSFDYYTVPRDLYQEDLMSDDLPFGSRGGIAIKHYFPLDGEYVIQVQLQRNYRDYIRGMVNHSHKLDVRINGERIKLFSIGGEKYGRSSMLYSTAAQGDVKQEEYERYADQALEVNFPAKAGIHNVTVAFLKDTTIPEEPLYPRLTLYDYTQYKGGEPGVRTVAIGGPYNPQGLGKTAGREKVFICLPASSDDQVCASQILSALARRAYRRQPTTEELNELLAFFRQGQGQDGFEAGIGMAIERILAGPEFLFMVERKPENVAPGEVYKISDIELATRLSLFLWSSIPDDELLGLAESGRLDDPVMLEQQVQRMLGDARSIALINKFASQWLNLGKLNVAVPDTEIFPYFDENLRQSLQMETRIFVEHVMRNDLPLLELLSADYTFVNERLARHYEIPDVYGSRFRKVSLQDSTRGGLLGHGSVLTVTSYANRTSPVIRGKWVLENILGAPPPAPPADVPGLRDKNDDGKVLTMREQMEQHRANPVCASCHKVMDPLGFALENYDAIGKWRTIDAASSSPIDATGSLPDGASFEGPSGLREVLLAKRQDDFILTVIEKLLTYALGREIRHTDAPVIRKIMRETEADEHRLSSIILSIIESAPFQMRRLSNHVGT